MSEILQVVFSENDLFSLDQKVDQMFLSDKRFQYDGVLKFSVPKELRSSGCPSVEDLIEKYSPVMRANLRRQNPVRLPLAKDVFGHVAVDSEYLDDADVLSCLEILQDVKSYEVHPEKNCCLQALGNGTDALLEHLHATVWANSKVPPSHYKQATLKNIKRDAVKNAKAFKELQRAVGATENLHEKSALLKEDLQLCHKEDQCVEAVCCCPVCITGDDVLDEDNEETEPVNTASYYAGKGFLYVCGINVDRLSVNLMTTFFSLSFLSSLTCTRMLHKFYPGISTSYMFIGMLHSLAPIHIEDVSLWSINYLYFGHPKIWVVVSPTMVSKLRYFLSRLKASGAQINCGNLLSHKYFVVTSIWLKKNGIAYKVVIQQPGEGVIVSPNAAHFVFNLGPNIAEAINFGSEAWLPYGIVYQGCACMLSQIHLNLQPMVASLKPLWLPAACGHKIPIAENFEYFQRSILHPHGWKESYDEGNETIEDMLPPDDVEDQDMLPEPTPEAVNQVRRRPQRRPICCPLCGDTYRGGHKSRLDNHIKTNHKKMSQKEKSVVKKYYKDRFPERGFKVAKRKCEVCGEFRGGSMKRHQATSACKPKNL